MPAIALSADGAFIFLALETSAGFPVFVKASRDDLSSWTSVYAPGAGSSANVASVPGNPDKMLFFGYMGSGVQVVSHVISTGTETNISPTGLGVKIVNTLCVNPSDPNEIVITVGTDFDLLHTIDLGTTWEAWYPSLGWNATGLAIRWDDPDRAFIGGYDGGDVDFLYTPNEGLAVANVAGAGLTAALNITNIELTREAT